MNSTEQESDPAFDPPPIQWSARRVLVILLLITTALAFVCLSVDLAANRWPDVGALRRLERAFILNGEANIPTWYSSLLWLIAAALAAAIAMERRSSTGIFVAHWFGFCAVCTYLSLDEAAMIHETIGDMISKVFRRWKFLRIDGGWMFSWMYFGIAFLIAFLLVYRRFLLHLPRRVLGLLMLAGGTYLLGALGVESLSAAAKHGNITILGNDNWDLMIAAEEFLEMIGVALLIFALLTYMRVGRVRPAFEVED